MNPIEALGAPAPGPASTPVPSAGTDQAFGALFERVAERWLAFAERPGNVAAAPQPVADHSEPPAAGPTWTAAAATNAAAPAVVAPTTASDPAPAPAPPPPAAPAAPAST